MDIDILEKAENLLHQCHVITLASVSEAGFPRVCAMVKVRNDGIKTIWVATGTTSRKTIHFKENPKASVCFHSDTDSVTLIGTVQIFTDTKTKEEIWQDWFIDFFPEGATDPNYCVLRFEAIEATLWINKCFETVSLP